MNRQFLNLPAPAKLNLFLHVLGRQPDGYHALQSVFVPIDLADTLDVIGRADGQLHRAGDLIGPLDGDLVLRAARLLQKESGTSWGADLVLTKRIPAGSGLGGGSSDAATTLLALNRLWRLDWSRERLAALALQLGADVPFFLGRGPAWVEGRGERLTPMQFGPATFALAHPGVSVSTAEIFSDSGLTRDTKASIIAAFSRAQSQFPAQLFGANDLQDVVRRRVPEVDRLLMCLAAHGPARMTGSGSAVFVPVADAEAGRRALNSVPDGTACWVVSSLAEHPLADW